MRPLLVVAVPINGVNVFSSLRRRGQVVVQELVEKGISLDSGLSPMTVDGATLYISAMEKDEE